MFLSLFLCLFFSQDAFFLAPCRHGRLRTLKSKQRTKKLYTYIMKDCNAKNGKTQCKIFGYV